MRVCVALCVSVYILTGNFLSGSVLAEGEQKEKNFQKVHRAIGVPLPSGAHIREIVKEEKLYEYTVRSPYEDVVKFYFKELEKKGFHIQSESRITEADALEVRPCILNVVKKGKRDLKVTVRIEENMRPDAKTGEVDSRITVIVITY